MIHKYSHLVIGGTFDHLHKGHRAFIHNAFMLSRIVIIGLVNKSLKQKDLEEIIQPYNDRYLALKQFLETSKYSNRYEIIPINDIYGTTLKDKKLEAILVTEETRSNAVIINKFRKKNRLSQLRIEIMPLIKSEDHKIIRSQRIRFGEIDRSGKIYGRMFKKKLQLPNKLREELRKPIGRIYLNSKQLTVNIKQILTKKTSLMISVGDIISQELEKNNIQPAVKIIDLYSQRKPIKTNIINYVSIKDKIINLPGFIYSHAAQSIHNAIKKYYQTRQSQTVVIKGEEDLLTLPTILLAPLGTLVVYGQKDVGAVVVEVTEEIKKKITNIIHQFQVAD